MALISQSDLEARLGRTLTANEVTSFAVINPALQSYVERYIGSSVEAVNATTRYYDGGKHSISIDPCTDLTYLRYVDDDTDAEYTFQANEYTLEPVNRTLKTELRNRWGKFHNGINNIAVTAKFSIYGDSQVLAIVKEAMIQYLASEIQSSSTVKKESIEGYSVEYASSESQSSLQPIKFLFPEF